MAVASAGIHLRVVFRPQDGICGRSACAGSGPTATAAWPTRRAPRPHPPLHSAASHVSPPDAAPATEVSQWPERRGVIPVTAASTPEDNYDIDTGGVGVKQNQRIPAFQLCPHVRDLRLQGEFPLAVVGALAQHECPDDPDQRIV